MATKKPTPVELVDVKMPVNWREFFHYGSLAIITVIAYWGAHQSTNNANQIKDVVATSARTEAKVDQVKHQTDGTITANLKTLAISAENLAVSTKSEKDIKAAREAWEAYDQRVLDMQNVETTKPSP